MALKTYPAIKTIIVPPTVPDSDIGDYVTCAAHALIKELGGFSIEEMKIEQFKERSFLFSYRTTTLGKEYQEKVEAGRPEPEELPLVSKDGMAKGNKAGPRGGYATKSQGA